MRLRLFRGGARTVRGTHRKTRRIRKRQPPAAITTQAEGTQPSHTARPVPPGQAGPAAKPAVPPATPAKPAVPPAMQVGPPAKPAGPPAKPAGPTAPAGPGLTPGLSSTSGAARAAVRIAPEPVAHVAKTATGPDASTSGHTAVVPTAAKTADARPWYATARAGRVAPGRRNCGLLEKVLIREWAEDEEPAAQVVTAIDRLAALPLLIKQKLAAGLHAIHVGSGGVPDLDDMGELAGVPLPSGRATWDACAGAYGDRKIVVGSRPSPTPDVMCHEVGHALDDIDGASGDWQSDSTDFRALYGRCLPHIASDFHRHGQSLGRREFFADAFAAIASSQRPALVEMLSGDTRTALDVMLYFNVRYGM